MPHPSGRPWIIAHRGASLQARENTLEAFVLAAELGADSVELDVRRTADDELVVHHDDTIATANRPLIDMTVREIRHIAPWVPTLEEALDAFPGWVDVEIKNDPREADFDPSQWVAHTTAARFGDRDIVITSFNPDAVSAAQASGLRTGILLGRGVDPATYATQAASDGHEFMLPNAATLAGPSGERIVAAAADAGTEVAVWTVDDPGEISRLAELGVGGIATNAPDVARSVLLEDDDGVRG